MPWGRAAPHLLLLLLLTTLYRSSVCFAFKTPLSLGARRNLRMMASQAGSGLVWFKSSDLRLRDHEALTKAHRESAQVLHAFIFDPRWFGPMKGARRAIPPGTLKTGYHRARFLLEAVADLKASLKAMGGDLVVRVGEPEVELPRLVEEHGVTCVYTHSEVNSEELTTMKAVSSHVPKLEDIWCNYLFAPSDLSFRVSECPQIFTQFRKSVESRGQIQKSLPIPSTFKPSPIPPSDDPLPTLESLGFAEAPAPNPLATEEAVLTYRGGETAAMDRLRDYIWEQDLLKVYKETRNGLLGPNFSSKFSPWLAQGNLSPRVAYEEIKRYESERVANDSTYWLVFELLWRDFFRYMGLYHGPAIFKLGGPQHDPGKYPWKHDVDLFDAWREGRTGYPFIDANMREIAATGFMSNRGRQVVASFLTRDMSIDWRWGAAYFEEVLLDYDPNSNYGNWNYVAGVGSDPREDRYFSIPKQGQTYDPEAKYIKHWLPELRDMPAEALLQPQMFTQAVRQQYGITEEVYPRPVVPLKFGGGGGGGARKGGHGGGGKGGGYSGGGRQGGRGGGSSRRNGAPRRSHAKFEYM